MSAALVVITRPKWLFLWLLDCMLAFHAPNYSSHYYTNSLTLCRLGQQTPQPLPSLYRKALTHSSHVSLHFFNSKLLFLPGSTCLCWCFYCFFFAFPHVFICVYWLFLIRLETFRWAAPLNSCIFYVWNILSALWNYFYYYYSYDDVDNAIIIKKKKKKSNNNIKKCSIVLGDIMLRYKNIAVCRLHLLFTCYSFWHS